MIMLLRRKKTPTINSQANATVERIHQIIGNMIRAFEVQDQEVLDKDTPWSEISAVRDPFHTITKRLLCNYFLEEVLC